MNRELIDQTADLLSRVDLDGPFELRQLGGGRNNRVYRVEGKAFRTLLKMYFCHPQDPRDRLATEFGFSQFAWTHGIRAIPEPLARDQHCQLGLYEFIEGRRLEADEITATRVSEMVSFFLALNRYRTDPQARSLSRASDSCLSLAEQISSVERRLERLMKIRAGTALERDAGAFVKDELVPAWKRTKQTLRERARELHLPIDLTLTLEERCLSPSDFGFHNAIVNRHGKIAFLDFEYAGWDDPAKMVCDLFCQPELPLPDAFFPWVAGAVAEAFADCGRTFERTYLVLPVCMIRWACLFLNEFIPLDAIRREFSGAMSNRDEQLKAQLALARRYVAASEERTSYGIH